MVTNRHIFIILLLIAFIFPASALYTYGTVYDAETGTGIQNATVFYMQNGSYMTVETNSYGNYTTDGVGNGTFSSWTLLTLDAWKYGYDEYYAYVTPMTDDNIQIDFVLTPTARSTIGNAITGVVRDGTMLANHYIAYGYGNPIPGARVNVKGPSGDYTTVLANSVGYYRSDESTGAAYEFDTEYDLWGSDDLGVHANSVNYTVIINAGRWSPRYSFGMWTTADGKMVIGGGRNQSYSLNDVWWSPNGFNWSRKNFESEWDANYDFGFSTTPNNTLLMAGGFQQLETTWASEDYGATWVNMTNDYSTFPGRNDFGMATASNGVTYITGGLSSATDGHGTDLYHTTSDGASWYSQAMPTEYWNTTSSTKLVAMHDGSLVRIGGYLYNPQPYKYPDTWNNSVWRSTDGGVTWVLQNMSPFPSINEGQYNFLGPIDPAVTVTPNDRIYVTGGQVNMQGFADINTLGDVWYSDDYGETWIDMGYSGGAVHALFPGRYKHGMAIQNRTDRLFIFGGLGYPTYRVDIPGDPLHFNCAYKNYTLVALNDIWFSDDMGATWSTYECSEDVRWQED